MTYILGLDFSRGVVSGNRFEGPEGLDCEKGEGFHVKLYGLHPEALKCHLFLLSPTHDFSIPNFAHSQQRHHRWQ